MGASAILLTNPRDLKFMCKAMKKLKPTALLIVSHPLPGADEDAGI